MTETKSPVVDPRVLATLILRRLPAIGCIGHGWAAGSTVRVYIEDQNGPCGYLSIHAGPGVSGEGLTRLAAPILDHARRCIGRCTQGGAGTLLAT